eukprot:3142518-Amphidinium_carterae.1
MGTLAFTPRHLKHIVSTVLITRSPQPSVAPSTFQGSKSVRGHPTSSSSKHRVRRILVSEDYVRIWYLTMRGDDRRSNDIGTN